MTLALPGSRGLTNELGERLAHTLTLGDTHRRSLVVVAHGVTGQHDRPYLNDLAQGLSLRGLTALQITYSGNGASEGRFEDSTISKEVADLSSVLDTLDGWAVGYAGHSMGGAVGALCASRDKRIQALCSLAGMVQVQAFMERVFGGLAPGEPMLGREQCPLSPALLDDARRIQDTLEPARQIQVPWLLVHGTTDELVPFSDSQEAQAASLGADLVPLEGADHRFSGHVPAMVEATVDFFDRNLP